MKKTKRKKKANLTDELVKALSLAMGGTLASVEHKCETGANFERRTFETNTIGSKENAHLKVVIHRWWGDRR